MADEQLQGAPDDGEQKSTRDPSAYRILVRPANPSAIWTPPPERTFMLLDAEAHGVSQDQARTKSKRVVFSDDRLRSFLIEDGVVVALAASKPWKERVLYFDDNMRLVWKDDV